MPKLIIPFSSFKQSTWTANFFTKALQCSQDVASFSEYVWLSVSLTENSKPKVARDISYIKLQSFYFSYLNFFPYLKVSY